MFYSSVAFCLNVQRHFQNRFDLQLKNVPLPAIAMLSFDTFSFHPSLFSEIASHERTGSATAGPSLPRPRPPSSPRRRSRDPLNAPRRGLSLLPPSLRPSHPSLSATKQFVEIYGVARDPELQLPGALVRPSVRPSTTLFSSWPLLPKEFERRRTKAHYEI